MLTLPPLFMSVWIERTWIGLRFFRFLIWFNFPDIMVYLRVITNSSTIRLAQVQTYRMKNMPTYFKSSSSPFQLLSYIIGGLMWFAGLLFLLGSDNTILFSFTIQKNPLPLHRCYLSQVLDYHNVPTTSMEQAL